MLLHDSRRDTRVSSADELIPLEEQNRELWNAELMEEGVQLVQCALRLHDIGPYQLQAAIAAVHAEAKTSSETDWKQIAALYQELLRLHPSAVVSLNHAVAIAMSEGWERGLSLLESIGEAGVLDGYHLYHAARADLLRRLGRNQEAVAAYKTALSLTANAIERRFLRRRMAEVMER